MSSLRFSPLFVIALAAIVVAGCSLNPQPIPPGSEEDGREGDHNGGATVLDPDAPKPDACEEDAGDAGACRASDSSDGERVLRRDAGDRG